MGRLLGEAEADPNCLSTSLPSLDNILGGGLRPGITQVSGPPNVGKSILVASIARAIQLAGGAVAWIDADNSYVQGRLDDTKLLYVRTNEGRTVLRLLAELPSFLDLLVVDNLNALQFGAPWDDDVKLAWEVSPFIGPIAAAASYYECRILIVNQEYSGPGGVRTTGGCTLKSLSPVWLKLQKTGRSHAKDGEVTGITFQATAVRNAYTLPFQEAHFAIEYGHIKDLGYSGGQEDLLPRPG
jgi:RecA/RadA recombinase